MYEIEIKSLLGDAEAAERLRQKMKGLIRICNFWARTRSSTIILKAAIRKNFLRF